MNKKVVTFGEIMMRLATENHFRFSQARNFGVTYGGGEFNVAVSLANYGISAEFVTMLPKNELGDCALNEIRKFNVQNHHIKFVDGRLGIYFLETGAGARSSNVIYDRAGSAMSNIKKGTFDWKEILKDANWFHWGGITPALSESAAEVSLEAVKAARELGITVSADLNYRSKLWKYGKNPDEVMPELLQYSNVILGDLDTAFFMLGMEKPNPDYHDLASLPDLYGKLFETLPNLEVAAMTLRNSVSASHQKIGGILYDGKTLYNTDIKDVTAIVDRVGTGDAFMGALVYGLLKYPDDKQKALDISVAACCLKHSISGDFNLITVEELEKFLGGDYSGKVSR
ncbi:MAG: sugar kinase [Bergeyella sp.]